VHVVRFYSTWASSQLQASVIAMQRAYVCVLELVRPFKPRK
jgi:hypothetical protein